jgi:hypothetical protein
MNRDWLETIRLLGLDAEFALVLTLLAADWTLRQVRRAVTRYQAYKRPLGPARLRQSTTTVGTEPAALAWEK